MADKTKNEKYISVAINEARKSEMAHKYGAVLVNRGKIISTGYNTYIKCSKVFYSIHAEVNCIKKCKIIPKNSILYLCRISSAGDILPSMACENCKNTIIKNNIRCIHSV